MTISNSLIIVSFLFTVFAFINPNLYNFGITNYFLNENNSFIFLLQILLYQFIHGGFFHFFFNSLFVYIFGNQLEVYIGKIKYLLFFIFNTLFVAFFLMMLSDGVTIGISGFCMALL
ncbi:MAG: rhomboid family intramembrane serine protease, partial [Candidatus Gracilibacteria bacterium]|nr:rhomboid family intramembrane serine protease [Candidatus Gracilibacteria bacterium]